MLLRTKKYLLCLLALLCVTLFATVGVIGFTQSGKTAYATATNTQTIDFGSDGITSSDAAAVNEFMTLLGGRDYDDLSAKLTLPKTASDFASAKTVTLGGVAFNIMYVSKAAYTANDTQKGDVIVTLWQADADSGSDYDSQFNVWGKDDPIYPYPSSMYGSSLIRSALMDKNDVNRKYVKTEGASELTAYNSSDENYKAQLETRWAPFKDSDGVFNGYLATPANMAWQKTQHIGVMSAYYFPNDAWDASTLLESNWKEGYNFSSKDTYSDWKNDKIWLPSLTETGHKNASGLWETTFIQQANTKNKNVRLRSVSENKADYTYLLFPTDRYADN